MSAHENPDDQPGQDQITDQLLRRHMGYCMKRAYLTVETVVTGVLNAHDMRIPVYSALGIIVGNPRLSQTALTSALNIERSNTVVIVDTLENRDLIARNRVEGDRRAYALEATLKGQRLFKKIADEVAEKEGALQAGMTSKQRDALTSFLAAIEQGGTRPDAVD